jgi:hypothetical protein
MLAPLAWAGFIQVLHDRAIERSNANLDHLIFGKFGVLYADTKNWSSTKSKLRLDRHGVLRYGKYPKTGEIATVRWEADRASQTLGWPVRAVIAVHGARVPGGCIHLDGVTVIQASLLRRYILRLPKAPGWNRQMVRETVDVADTRLPEAAKKHPATYPAKGRRPSRPTTRHKSRTRT